MQSQNPRTTFAETLLAMNGGKEISDDEKNTASLLCNAAIEARVIGLDKPAMYHRFRRTWNYRYNATLWCVQD